MIDLSFDMYVILFFVAFIAGVVDSIAGGGGMITIPVLLLSGIPPHIALGTNKLQSCFGSFSATFHFYKKGYVNLWENAPHILCVFIFATLGTLLVNVFNSEFLSKCIPFLLIVFAIYFLFSPKIKTEGSKPLVSPALLVLILGFIGFYDGFFGPGTGSFLMFALILLGGHGILHSLARAKLYNFTSNLASFIVFALLGHTLFLLGLVMGIAQFIGANIGAKIAMKHGVRIIKPLIVTMSIIVCVKLLYK